MNATEKAAWTTALRSGEYKQTTGDLQNHEGYCCLGVLNATLGRQGYGGLSDIIGGDCWVYMHLNDGLHKSFAEIADYVDEHVIAVPRTDAEVAYLHGVRIAARERQNG